jgi:hypothetical protein
MKNIKKTQSCVWNMNSRFSPIPRLLQAAEELSQRYPGRILLLRYEDLSIEPETTTRLGPTVPLAYYTAIFFDTRELSPYTLLATF